MIGYTLIVLVFVNFDNAQIASILSPRTPI